MAHTSKSLVVKQASKEYLRHWPLNISNDFCLGEQPIKDLAEVWKGEEMSIMRPLIFQVKSLKNVFFWFHNKKEERESKKLKHNQFQIKC